MATVDKLDIERALSKLNEKTELFEKKDVDVKYLPRNLDILAYIYYLKDTAVYRTKFESLYQIVVQKVVIIWKKTQIPIMANGKKHGDKNIQNKIDKVLQMYKKIKRNIRAGKANANDLKFFYNIFNITRCTCVNLECCQCSFKENITECEYLFLLDQATTRELEIDEFVCDMVANKSLDSHLSNLSITSSPAASNQKCQLHYTTATANISDNKIEMEDQDPDYRPPDMLSIPLVVNIPKSIKYLNTDGALLESMRFNSSFQSTAAIINRTLEAVGAITNEEKGLVVTPSLLKVRAKQLGNRISKEWMNKTKKNRLECFFFDGVSMHNNVMIEKNNKQVADNSAVYDNIAIVQQPNNHFIGFVSTLNSDAESIFQKLIGFFTENEIDLSHVFAIGSDGAATNVGNDNGVIRKLELALKRPLHRIICLLHLLEVVLKAVICYYFGENIVKYKQIGQINKDIDNCHTYPDIWVRAYF